LAGLVCGHWWGWIINLNATSDSSQIVEKEKKIFGGGEKGYDTLEQAWCEGSEMQNGREASFWTPLRSM